MKRAASLTEIKHVLRPNALVTPEELAALFVETSDARDPQASQRAALFDHLDTDANVKMLVYGLRGTGKSTELNRFAQEYASRYTVFRLSLMDEKVLGQVTAESLLVLISERLLAGMHDIGLPFPDSALQHVYGWFSEAFQYREQDVESSLRVGGGADTSDSWWGKLVGLRAFLTADIRTGSHVLNKTITKENRRISELAHQCDLLVKDARTLLQSTRKKELLLLIDDMDKISLAEADSVLIENPALLGNLSCKAVYTAPMSLRCSPRATEMELHFRPVVFPMIKVTERDGTACVTGRAVIREILERRLEVDRLLEPEALDLAVEKTGGVLRHLFDVLIDAAFAAREAARREVRDAAPISRRAASRAAPITPRNVRWGLDQLKNNLLSRIGTAGLPAAYRRVETEQLVTRLRELAGKCERAVSDEVNQLLMNAHALIEYNGEGWCRLHPLVEEHYGASLAAR
jgi:GTPase SAR1 family protein